MIRQLTWLCRKDKIQWECDNGGQLWSASAAAGYGTSSETFPTGFCAAGFSSLNVAFIVGLLVDLVFQVGTFGHVCFVLPLGLTETCDLTRAAVHVLHGLAVPEEARALLGHEGSVLWR